MDTNVNQVYRAESVSTFYWAIYPKERISFWHYWENLIRHNIKTNQFSLYPTDVTDASIQENNALCTNVFLFAQLYALTQLTEGYKLFN